MRIIEPSVEIITETDPLKKIELCGRVCYKSEDKITEDSAKAFVKKIIERGHTSVLEHEVFGIHFDSNYSLGLIPNLSLIGYNEKKLGQYSQPKRHFYSSGNTLFANIRAWREFLNTYDFTSTLNTRAMNAIMDSEYAPFFTDMDYLRKNETPSFVVYHPDGNQILTVRFICDRGVSHELVRHRCASFSQESTRYCDYSGEMTFIKPCFEWAQGIPIGWFDYDNICNYDDRIPNECSARAWLKTCEYAERYYQIMRSLNVPPQEARSILPNSLKTEIIMTATHKEWIGILNLRLAPAAHPQMRQVMQMLVNHPEFPKSIKEEIRYDQS